VIVAVWFAVTVAAVAVKVVLVVPAGIVTVAGIVKAVLLLERLNVKPPLGAAVFRVAMQAAVPAPVMELLAQFSAVRLGSAAVVAVPEPFNPMTSAPEFVALLETAICPVTAPDAVGAKLRFTL
jgi:hypothetical protein